jgi:hypothetical protein
MIAIRQRLSREAQLMYSLLRCAYGPEHIPEGAAGVIKPQKVMVLRRAFSDFVDGERLSTALAFALADIAGPGSRELAKSLGKSEEEGERLAMLGREAVGRFLLALLRMRPNLREEARRDVDRLFLATVYTLLNIYSRARQHLSLATLIMTGNSKIFEGMDEAAREFARELEELLNPDAAQAKEAAEALQQTDQRQEAQPAREPSEKEKELEELRRKLKRLRIAATLAKSSLTSPT